MPLTERLRIIELPAAVLTDAIGEPLT